MKKIICLLVIVIMSALSVQANDCTFYCASPYGLSPAPLRVLANATGSNFLAEKIAQSIIKKEIKKTSEGKYKVKLNSYSVSDLKKGKFKSFEIQGKDVVVDEVSVSSILVKTLCDFNYIEPSADKKNVTFKEDLNLEYKIVLNENDLNNTMKTSDYTKVINDLNSLARDYSIFNIHSTQVKIRNNKFYYVVRVAMPFIRTTQDIVLESDLMVKNGEIAFANTKLVNDRFSFDLSKLSYVLNYLNPLEFSLQILENKDTVVNVKEVAIVDNKVNVAGTIFVPKDVVAEHKEY